MIRYFGRFGTIVSMSKHTRYAFVEYDHYISAIDAAAALNGKDIFGDGDPLTV